MAGPYNVVAARLSPDTPVCGVPLEPYVLARRADSSTVTGGAIGRHPFDLGRVARRERRAVSRTVSDEFFLNGR